MDHPVSLMPAALAAATMAPRLLIEVAAIEAVLPQYLWIALLVLGGVPLGATLLLSVRRNPPGHGVEPAHRNPLTIRTAVVLGIGIAVLFALIRGTREWFGDTGTSTRAALSGIFDVDAVAVSFTGKAENFGNSTASRAIIMAALVNTGAKALTAWVLGGLGLGLTYAAILGNALLLAAGTMLL